MNRASRGAASALILIMASCTAPAGMPVASVVERWLTCTECVDGELVAVRSRGSEAVPALRAALDGPSPQARSNMSRSSTDAFLRARRQWERQNATDRILRPLGDSATFVSRNVGNFQAMYQLRAARALALVDPTGARRQLTLKLTQDSLATQKLFRGDVRQFVDSLARTLP